MIVAKLDQFINLLLQRRGDSLALVGGEPVVLSVDGKAHPVSRDPLPEPSITSLLKEIAPDGALSTIAESGELTFPYSTDAGTVNVDVQSQGSQLKVVLTPAGSTGGNGADADSGVVGAPASAGNGRQHAAGRADLDQLLEQLMTSGGSDLHLRVGQPPLFRKDGRLVRLQEDPCDVDRIQAMLESVIPPQDEEKYATKGDADFAYEIPDVARFRVNAARDRGGPMAVLRVIPSVIPTCDQLDIGEPIRRLCDLTKGLVVVTGPTGSGKSTTLAAMVDLMNEKREEHILTIEDPIEFVHTSKQCLVTHRQVGLHTESFQTGLRAALREDPDIILIGELRDLETVSIAIETAETGHLVFGTLHTTTAPSTIDRMIDQFPPDRQEQIRVMLSESMRGVVAQTLCRKIGGGRVAAREILLATPAVSNLIRDGKTFQIASIMQTQRKLGMITLNDSLLDLVDRKLIEPKEAYLKAVDRVGIEGALKERGSWGR